MRLLKYRRHMKIQYWQIQFQQKQWLHRPSSRLSHPSTRPGKTYKSHKYCFDDIKIPAIKYDDKDKIIFSNNFWKRQQTFWRQNLFDKNNFFFKKRSPYIVNFFRGFFYLFFADLENIPTEEIQKAISLGIRFDLKLAILTFFPLALIVLISNYRFFKNSVYKRIAAIYLVLAYLILTLFYLFDFGYYEYLAIRLDASSLRFLSNFKISSGKENYFLKYVNQKYVRPRRPA